MQSKPFADIIKDIAQIWFASLFVGSLASEKLNWLMLMFGFFGSLSLWILYIAIMNKFFKK